MKTEQNKRRHGLLWIGGIVLILIAVAVVGLFVYVGVITHRIDARIEQLRSTRSSNFYALYPSLKVNERFSVAELRSFLGDQGYLEKRSPDELAPGEYAWDRSSGLPQLTLHRGVFTAPGHPLDRLKARIIFNQEDGKLVVKEIVRLDTNEPIESFESLPKKIASFFAGRLRTQNAIPFSDMPVSVRLSVMAIEDIHFLEHKGVSVRGTVRALWNDIKLRKFAEGGSTITQQLMKNLFFSRDKALSRKIKEALFALVTEIRHEKNEILEAYLNEVYMGQWGTHEIHGVSDGARYYFNRPVSELSLPQAATLAAIIQAPNYHDPHRFPDRCIKRRNVVLKKMADEGFILPAEYEMAAKEPLGVVPSDRKLDDVDYFNDLVMDRIPAAIRKRLDTDALSIYVTLNPYLQAAATQSVKANIDRLMKTPALQKKEKRGYHLQSALISVNVKDCTVLALQGGRSYRQTQFNRVLQAKRQAGSLFKPFAYLAGFASKLDPPITAVTQFDDSPFEWKYSNQVWRPKDYEEENRGEVTVRQALELSLNIPTARLTQKVGVAPILEVLQRAGIQSPMPPVPSISLGSADVPPFEVATAYTTLARLGKSCPLRAFTEVYDENRNLILQDTPVTADALPATATFQTVDILKGVFVRGTARWASTTGLKLANFAGKTGTTNENKDAWFVGFSPEILTLIWVGFDEEEKVGLTGAGAALPVWVEYMKAAQPFLTGEDFVVPEGLKPFDIDPASRALATARCPEKQTEYFVPGTQPQNTCPLHNVP